MARPTDQEMTSIKKRACYTHRSPKEGACHTIGGGGGGGHMEKPQGEPRGAEGVRGNVVKSLYCGFHGKEGARQSKQTWDG